MKSFKALCAIGIFSLVFSSCSYQEDTAAFFIANQLNKSLTVENSSEVQSTAYANVDVDITSIESYEMYINRITDLNITKLEFRFANYAGSISNGQLFLDGMLLSDFQGNNGLVSITDPAMLANFAERFLEKTSLEFTFVGESNTQHFLSVDLEIELMATFVY